MALFYDFTASAFIFLVFLRKIKPFISYMNMQPELNSNEAVNDNTDSNEKIHNTDMESDYIHISKEDIFHADPATVSFRRLLGVIYLLCGIGMIVIATNFSPVQTGSHYTTIYCGLGFLLAALGIFFFFAAWHKRSYRSFINESGIGCSNSHNIVAHAWHEVDYVLQRLYYWGTPPHNGVWGVAPRRLDEDYVVVLKTGEKLFFGRRNLGHLSRFKPLILYYTEQNNVNWTTQDVYHSRRLKAGKKLIPTLIALFLALTPIVLLTSQGALVYGIQNHMFVLTEEVKKQKQADRFSWTIEFRERQPQQINQCDNPGSTNPLNVQVTSMYITRAASTVAVGTPEGKFYMRDIETNTELGSMQPISGLYNIKFIMISEDQTKVLMRDMDRQLMVWDISKKRELLQLEVPNKYYESAIFSTDGNLIYFGDLTGRVNVYDLQKSGECVNTFEGANSPVTYILAAGTGRKVVIAYENNSVSIRDLFMPGEPIILNLDSRLICADFTSDNQVLGTLEENGTFKIWNYSVKQDTLKSIVSNADEKFHKFAFSNNGKAVAFGSDKGTISLYSVIKSQELEKLTVPGMESPTPILSLIFTPDDQYLIVGTKYGIWKVKLPSFE